MSHFARLPSSRGSDVADTELLETIERVQTHLDDAEKLLSEGCRSGGMFFVGKASALLDALVNPVVELVA